MYTGILTHIHSQSRNPQGCPSVVRRSYQGALAGRCRIAVFAKRALYPAQLPGVRLRRRPQQLRALWQASESTFLNLCPREAGARGARRHSKRPGIAGFDQSGWGALRQRAQASVLADEVSAGRNGQPYPLG